MAPRLRQYALPRIDENDRDIGGRGARRHVAGILLVAGRVGDDERTPVGLEIAIGDIDGDALFALGGEPIHQQREIEIGALRAEFFRIAVERLQLIVGDHAGIVKQAPDQSRFAVIDGAAGDEAQQGFFQSLRRRRGVGNG